MITLASNINFENIREMMSLDPFDIKKSLVDLIDKNLGVKNPDTYEAGFLGYLTQAQTLLTSDVLFNNSMAWNEAFTHLLVLPTSLQNHANMLDYTLKPAAPCDGFITVYVPFPDNMTTYQLTLKNGTQCAGNVAYLVKDTYLINVSMSPSVQKKDSTTGIVTEIETNVEIRDGSRYLIFAVEVWQINIYSYTETFTDVKYKEFYDVNIGGIGNQFYDINIGVYMSDDNYTNARLIKFNQIPSIYGATSKDRVYTFKYYGDGRGTVRFGNGVFGFQPKEGSTGEILIYTTLGKDGAAYPGQIQLDAKLIDFYSNKTVDIYGTNLETIDNGSNEDDIEVSKHNIIAQISSAKRLVTKSDYQGFEGITGIRNTEIFPMLLRRDTNVNEIDLFTVLYDIYGMPIPTTNLNYIIDNDRNILSKDYVYKLAIKYGENGVELVPNTIKILNENAVDYEKHDLYAALYVDSEYDNYDNIYEDYDKMIIYMYSDNDFEYFKPDEVREFICPYNVAIEQRQQNRLGIFEYIPQSIHNIPKVEDQVDYIDIDIAMTSVFFDYMPNESMAYSNVKPTHLNVINNFTISSNVTQELMTSYIVISKEGEEDSFKYDCEHKYINVESNELSTSCMIPIDDLFRGELLFECVVYYAGRYYNTYKKYFTFVDQYDLTLKDDYVGYPYSMGYDPADPRTMPTLPAIDKVYIGVTNINVEWSNWKDADGFKVDGYIVDVVLNKLSIVDINKIGCKFSIGYGGNTYEMESISSFSDTMVTYRFKVPYNPLHILDGATYYQVWIYYKFKTNEGKESPDFTLFATYGGYVIFRRRFSNLMWCNIERVENFLESAYKIYRIPVIDKTYYLNHKTELENEIFYQLAELDARVIDYKMLTDKMCLKFAKTIGSTENLKYNDNVRGIDQSLKYGGWTTDLPLTIKLSILVSRYTNRNRQEIVNECKQVLLSFLQLKANFNACIIRSEIKRFIHDTIPDIISCEVIEPTRDIIYFYGETELPKDKDTLLSYNPEFMWIDVNKISIETILTPV